MRVHSWHDSHVLTASASTATPCWRQTQPDACVTCDTLVFPEISMNGLGQHHQGGVWTPPLLLAAALAPQRNVFYRLLPSRRGAEASSKRLFKVIPWFSKVQLSCLCQWVPLLSCGRWWARVWQSFPFKILTKSYRVIHLTMDTKLTRHFWLLKIMMYFSIKDYWNHWHAQWVTGAFHIGKWSVCKGESINNSPPDVATIWTCKFLVPLNI